MPRALPAQLTPVRHRAENAHTMVCVRFQAESGQMGKISQRFVNATRSAELLVRLRTRWHPYLLGAFTITAAVGSLWVPELVLWSLAALLLSSWVLTMFQVRMLGLLLLAAGGFAVPSGLSPVAFVLVPCGVLYCHRIVAHRSRRERADHAADVSRMLLAAFVGERSGDSTPDSRQELGQGSLGFAVVRSLARLDLLASRLQSNPSPSAATLLAAADEDLLSALAYLEALVDWNCTDSAVVPVPVDLGSEVLKSCAELEALRRFSVRDFRNEVPDGVTVGADPVLLRRSLVVLLRAALEQAPGIIRVTAEQHDHAVELSVVAEISDPKALTLSKAVAARSEETISAVTESIVGLRHPYGGLALPAARRWLLAMGCELVVDPPGCEGVTIRIRFPVRAPRVPA